MHITSKTDEQGSARVNVWWINTRSHQHAILSIPSKPQLPLNLTTTYVTGTSRDDNHVDVSQEEIEIQLILIFRKCIVWKKGIINNDHNQSFKSGSHVYVQKDGQNAPDALPEAVPSQVRASWLGTPSRDLHDLLLNLLRSILIWPKTSKDQAGH